MILAGFGLKPAKDSELLQVDEDKCSKPKNNTDESQGKEEGWRDG